jgi:hypothetical protein
MRNKEVKKHKKIKQLVLEKKTSTLILSVEQVYTF